MAPKKKGNKKGNEDWEAELGESPNSVGTAAQEITENDAAKEQPNDEVGGGGGLLAALKKNKKIKKAKGKHVEEDNHEEEDSSMMDDVNGNTDADASANLENKSGAEEATANDLFAPIPSKGKSSKTKKDEQIKEDEDGIDETGGLKSKKEKEKEKKEREKQRKRDQVRLSSRFYYVDMMVD